MSTGLRRLVALGILGLGACAALPFYQRPSRLHVPQRSSHGEDAAWCNPDLNLQAPAAPQAAVPAASRVLPPSGVRRPSPPPPVHRQPASGSIPELDFEYPSRLPSLPAAAALPGEPPFAHQPSPPARRHRVVDGDTLQELARKHLGDGQRALEIFEANRDRIHDPDVLPIGVELVIPSDEARGPRHGQAPRGVEGSTPAADADGLVPVLRLPRD